MINNTSHTLPAAHRTNIARIALHPRGHLLLSIDQEGHAILTHFQRRVVLYHFSLKSAVHALAFSPCGRYFVVGIGRKIEVWRTPSTPGEMDGDGQDGLEFAPFVRHRQYAGHHDKIQNISWSSDSRFFISASHDLTARIWSVDPEEDFVPTVLSAGHRTAVYAAWFSSDQEIIYTVSQDGALFEWRYEPAWDPAEREEDVEFWQIQGRHYFHQTRDGTQLTTAAFHAASNLLVTGFSNGLFMIHELPTFSEIHKLSVAANTISTVAISPDASWLAFASGPLGQLLVWEWQSESYILKQQGHFDNLNALTYSPSGDRVITASDDGKVKVWDPASGFCIVTFTEHTSSVTACEFARRGNVLFTASLDGSVRAFDLLRYRCFRTFTAPKRLSFSSLAVDPSGEVVAAGSLDDFDIHVWSVQTGQLLDRLSGHEGPVPSLAFAPSGGSLVSGSWDHTVRIWSVFARTQTSEPLQLQSDVLCVAVRPDGKQIAVSTLDGQLTFWSMSEAIQQSGLDGRRDISGGRKLTDRRAAANVTATQSFRTLAYSGDGSVVLAAGNSKYICLYSVSTAALLHKYTVSVNLSLQGTQEFLNSAQLNSAAPIQASTATQQALSGAHREDAGSRATATTPTIRVPAVAFSPTGRAFCAATTEGLHLYTLDRRTAAFDPVALSAHATPATALAALHAGNHLTALLTALALNLPALTAHIYRQIPAASIPLVARALPPAFLVRVLRLVAREMDATAHVERNLLWMTALLRVHGQALRDGGERGEMAEVVRASGRAVRGLRKEVGALAEENENLVAFLTASARARPVEGDGDGGGGGGGEDTWMGLD